MLITSSCPVVITLPMEIKTVNDDFNSEKHFSHLQILNNNDKEEDPSYNNNSLDCWRNWRSYSRLFSSHSSKSRQNTTSTDVWLHSK